MSNKRKTGPTLDSSAIQAHMFPGLQTYHFHKLKKNPQISIEEENNYRSDEIHTKFYNIALCYRNLYYLCVWQETKTTEGIDMFTSSNWQFFTFHFIYTFGEYKNKDTDSGTSSKFMMSQIQGHKEDKQTQWRIRKYL